MDNISLVVEFSLGKRASDGVGHILDMPKQGLKEAQGHIGTAVKLLRSGTLYTNEALAAV